MLSQKTNQEPPQDSDIHQLIEECSVEVPEHQKQNIEKTMLDLVKICHHKQFLCMHDNVDDFIESALDPKLLLINSINSQRLDKKEQEVKIVEEQPAERRNRIEKSLQNFRVIHKSSISLNTSQISLIHSTAPILSTKEPENSLSMGYEHLSITPETESDEFTEFNAKNLLPIPSECEVTSEDKRECDELVCDNHSDTFSNSKIDDDISVYDDDFEDIDYVEASLLDPEIVSIEEENGVEEENVVQREEEEVEDISQVQDVVLREKLLSITRLISNIESLNDNSTPDCVFNSFESDNSLLDNFSPEIETFCDHSEETRSVTLPMLITLFPNMIHFALRLSPIRRGEEIAVVMIDNDDSQFFMFDKEFSLLFAESEDTTFDPVALPKDKLIQGLSRVHDSDIKNKQMLRDYSPEIEVILCRIYARFPRYSYPLIDFSLGRSISF
uniref:Reverse transcriptase domain-containing protein n=1 Tax=Tanacetum cinerariifolium TaxID=118510 RepID=A0A699IWF8_TANCI|nr:hypothetical protein [Tanacetum cinerariifolium]